MHACKRRDAKCIKNKNLVEKHAHHHSSSKVDVSIERLLSKETLTNQRRGNTLWMK